MPYTKPWKSAADQLASLKARGLLIDNYHKAGACLDRIGYYRLSGYWFAFRERSGPVCTFPKSLKNPGKVQTVASELFKHGASFQNAVDLYVFDKQLRLLALDALERIEIALRVDISHMLGELDRFAYLRPDLFHAKFTQEFNAKTGTTAHHEWLSSHGRLINRSREDLSNTTGKSMACLWQSGLHARCGILAQCRNCSMECKSSIKTGLLKNTGSEMDVRSLPGYAA